MKISCSKLAADYLQDLWKRFLEGDVESGRVYLRELERRNLPIPFVMKIFLPEFKREFSEAERRILAEFSRMRGNEEIDPAGMERAVGVPSFLAQRFLAKLEKAGLAKRDGNWFSRTPLTRGFWPKW